MSHWFSLMRISSYRIPMIPAPSLLIPLILVPFQMNPGTSIPIPPPTWTIVLIQVLLIRSIPQLREILCVHRFMLVHNTLVFRSCDSYYNHESILLCHLLFSFKVITIKYNGSAWHWAGTGSESSKTASACPVFIRHHWLSNILPESLPFALRISTIPKAEEKIEKKQSTSGC